ncbi:MAG: hypothetical protein HKN47_11700 [Pirellulaceae bacterium]|nr:hypothetical protein [Pirellulaceae bacterium]
MPTSDDGFIWSVDSIEPTYRDLKAALAAPQLADIIDRDKVFLLGFSQGALHAMLVGARHPNEFAGVVSISPGGALADQLAVPKLNVAAGKSRLFFVHAKSEPHAPYVIIWRDAYQRAGWAFDSATHDGGHHFPESWDTMRPEVAKFLLSR